MNAKKIMGAVLVALLAAALFVGAGAAAGGETVFVYQVVTEDPTPAPGKYAGTWYNGANSITFVPVPGGVAIMGDNVVEGVYSQGDYDINVKYPTGSIIGYGTYTDSNGNPTNYPVLGASYYELGADSTLSLDLASASTGVTTVSGIAVIGGDNIPMLTRYTGSAFDESIFNGKTGTFKLQVFFAESDSAIVDTPDSLSTLAPQDFRDTTFKGVILGKDVFTITIVDGADPTITAAVDTVIAANTVDVTITGLPGVDYEITGTGFTVVPGQAANAGNSVANANIITMPNSGKVTVSLEAGTITGDFTLFVEPATDGIAGDKAELTLEIVPGTITAVADKDAYYIGNKVTITGTSTAGSTVYFYYAGTNTEFAKLPKSDLQGAATSAAVKNGEFEYVILGEVFEGLDAGTYTVYVANNNQNDDGDPVTKVEELDTYATVALVLKQPFVSFTDAPSVAVKGSTFKVTGTAEAADAVYAYVFGTNFFAAVNSTKNVAFGDLEDDELQIELNKNAFAVKANIPTDVYDMAAGQYFLVVQHPMYDGLFNIAPNATEVGKIVLNSTGDATKTKPDDYNTLFNVTDRQKANAAEALCQAIDTENIDDMYVKLSFVVAAPQSVINPIPAEIAQGEKLVVSGSTNVGAGEVVTVELLSTAFAAVPKATVGSASFISLTTKTDEDGNWEVTFDTSGLNVDEYTLTAAVNALSSSSTAKIKVVEAAPETPDTPDTPDVPDTPDTPDTPDVPETPGFGALAALAGLGAVAVLLLRRE